MRLRNLLLVAAFAVCGCLPVLAQQNVTFTNNDGMFSGSALHSGTLSLNTSELIGIQGFTGSFSGFDTLGTVSIGTLNFTTGNLMSTMAGGVTLANPRMIPLTGQVSTFGAGGGFHITSSFNGGFTFDGTFTAASWACHIGSTCALVQGTTNQWKGTWDFSGTLSNVVLTINGQQFAIGGAVTVQATAINQILKLNSNGTISVKDNQGFTNFNIAPEPGTLSLFGSGLIALGLVAKFSGSRRSTRNQA